MGTLLFQIFGGAAPPKDTTAPAANGFALVAVIAAFAGISGAHLNPAVTFALTCTGHMVVWKGLCYAVAQVRDEMMRERGEGRRQRAAQGPPKKKSTEKEKQEKKLVLSQTPPPNQPRKPSPHNRSSAPSLAA
jgi:hypothetical protein